MTPCPGSCQPTEAIGDEVACPACGRVVRVRTDRCIQRHNEPATS